MRPLSPPAGASVTKDDIGCACPSCFSLVEGKDFHWLRSTVGELVLAGALLVIAYILRSFDHSADIRNNHVFRWLFLVSLLAAVYVGGRFVDWIVFRAVSRLAVVPLFSTTMFYCLALEGMVQHLTWIVVGVRRRRPLAPLESAYPRILCNCTV